jgi:uncharacterized protein (TIGR03067 family)
MQANQEHPQVSLLNAFALGTLDPADIDAVESHLAGCDTCCDALKQMKEDTFVGLVREAREARDVEAPHVAPIAPVDMQQAATLPASDTSAFGAAAPPQPDSRDSLTVAPAADAIDVSNLPAEMIDHPRYRILELVGTGGMGAVYKAEHRLMQRTVALKVINPKFIQSKQAVERFRREVQAAARLQHPNIVHAYDAEQAGDVHYLVMEYVPGTDLGKVLEERGPLPVAEACEYVRQAALGLQHAHEHGMVHRDIKPQNLMVTRSPARASSPARSASKGDDPTPPLLAQRAGTVKILDFGLASLTSQAAHDEAGEQQATVDSQKSGLTQAGALMGTPDYMAPEQARDARGADIRSDIYSLGCTLYTLLAGKVPFPGGSAVDKVIAHASNHAAPIEKVRDDVPAGLAEVLGRMITKSPADRFPTPADVAAALAPFTEPPAAPTIRGRRRWRGRVAALAAIAAGVLLLLAGFIFIRTNNGTLKIDCEVDDVQVVVSQGGEQLEVIDLPTGSTVKRFPTGNYDIALKGKNLKVKLDTSGFTITRSGLAVVKVTLTDETRQAKIAAATKAAETWLALMDAGEVEKAWDQSSALAHKALGREEAIKSYQNLRRVVGKLKWRMVYQRDYAATRPGLPPGDYVKIDYAAYFETLKETSESVFMAREKDGQWRPFLYATLAWPAGQAFPPPATAPFDAALANQYQEGWAQHLGVEMEIANSLGMMLRLIPAGKLALHPQTSNRPDGSVNEVNEPFYAGVHEVTVGQFRQFVKETGYKTTAEKDRSGGIKVLGGSRGTSRDRAFVWSHPDFAGEDNVPVVFVTWHDAMAFCRWLSKKEGRTYRLPSEVESLWLLRAGSPGRYFFGDDAAELDAYSWHSKRGAPLDRPRPVGQKRPNPWGLYDVHGNVGELCYEWLSLGAKPRLEAAQDGPGVNNALVQRGGGYADEADAGTGGTGWFRTPMSHIGFRVVLAVEPKTKLNPDAQNVSAALQGHWKPASVEQNGEPVPAEALNRIQFPTMFLFKDNRWGAVSPDGRRYESTFTLEADKDPIRIDVKGSLFEGMPDMHGILKAEKDTVTVCVVEKDQARPTEFTTKGKRGSMLIVARRLSETDAKIELATQAAEAWLRLMDAGDHGQAWEQASQAIRNALTKKNFVMLGERTDSKLGKLKARTVLDREYKRDLPGAPRGEYVAIQYRSEYEKWPKVAELVVPMLESDGVWRVSGWHNNLEHVPPDEREFTLAVRAGRGELSKEELQDLAKQDHPLAALLADPGKKAILEWFASLPDGAHQHLLKEGYLKWKVASLDAERQKTLREGVKRGLEEAKKLGVAPPPTQSLEALAKADIGFALVNVLGQKHSFVSWYLQFPASPQPGFAPLIGAKVENPQALAEAHLIDLTALRAKAYSKSIEDFGNADKQARMNEPGAVSAGHFVVLAGDAKPKHHATLAQAISAAKSGATIEIRGNGPFSTLPIDIRGTALRIKAGAGYRPVILANPEADKSTNQRSSEPLLKTDAPLAVEGIEFQILGEGKRFQPTAPALIRSVKAPLHAANCRFLVIREGPTTPCIIAEGCPKVELRNCELLVLGHHHAVVWTYSEGGRLVMDNCVHLGFCPLATICLDDRQASVRIARSTLTGWGTFIDYSLWGGKLDLSKRKQPLEIDVSENAVEASNLLVCAYNAEHYPAAKQILELLPQAIRWRDHNNRYAVQNALLGHYGARPFTESLVNWRTLAEWEAYWHLTDIKSTITEALSFAGDKKEANLRSKLTKTPEQFSPTEFRLAKGGDGQGKEVGADVDLVGPGTAYERWKQTPAYPAWRDALARQGFKEERRDAANETAKLQGTFTMKTLGDGANWAMTLDGAGKFKMTRNGQLGVEGSYKVAGDTIEFTDEAGPFREQGNTRTGTYRWRLAGTKLIFDRLRDEARGRSTILLSNAWDKK